MRAIGSLLRGWRSSDEEYIRPAGNLAVGVDQTACPDWMSAQESRPKARIEANARTWFKRTRLAS
jgi:hypothetical protein